MVLSVDSTEGTYRAVDTVTGMVVEEEGLPRPADQLEEVPDSCKGKSFSEDPACRDQFFRHLLRDPEFQLFLADFSGKTPRVFYSIEITNPEIFLAWINAPAQ